MARGPFIAIYLPCPAFTDHATFTRCQTSLHGVWCTHPYRSGLLLPRHTRDIQRAAEFHQTHSHPLLPVSWRNNQKLCQYAGGGHKKQSRQHTGLQTMNNIQHRTVLLLTDTQYLPTATPASVPASRRSDVIHHCLPLSVRHTHLQSGAWRHH